MNRMMQPPPPGIQQLQQQHRNNPVQGSMPRPASNPFARFANNAHESMARGIISRSQGLPQPLAPELTPEALRSGALGPDVQELVRQIRYMESQGFDTSLQRQQLNEYIAAYQKYGPRYLGIE